MVIKSLLNLDKKEQAIWYIAKAPLKLITKRQLLYLLFPELEAETRKKIDSIPRTQITIRCPNCTRVLFFAQNRPKCLFCE